jgi:hypothetical protein
VTLCKNNGIRNGIRGLSQNFFGFVGCRLYERVEETSRGILEASLDIPVSFSLSLDKIVRKTVWRKLQTYQEFLNTKGNTRKQNHFIEVDDSSTNKSLIFFDALRNILHICGEKEWFL